MKAHAHALKKERSLEYFSLMFVVTIFVALGTMYMYLLSASVIHVVMSKETEEKIHRVNSEIAVLEAEYMERQHVISEKIVEQNGYVKVAEKIFIDVSEASFVTQR